MVDLREIQEPADVRIRVGRGEIALNNGMSEVTVFKTWNGGDTHGVMVPRHLMPPDRSWMPARVVAVRGRDAVLEFPVGNDGRTRWTVPLSILESWLDPQPEFERFEEPRHTAIHIEPTDTVMFTTYRGYCGVIVMIGPSEHGAVVHRESMSDDHTQLYAEAYGATPLRTALRIKVMGHDHVKWLVDTEGLADKLVDPEAVIGSGHGQQRTLWRCPTHPEIRPRWSKTYQGMFCPMRVGQATYCPNTSWSTPSAPYHPRVAETEEASA